MTRRRAQLRLSALCLLALSVVSCGLFVSFDDYDTSRSTVPAFSVGGTATGILTPITVKLNGTTSIALAKDGEFTFPVKVPDGADYRVDLGADPPGESCGISNQVGKIAGADVRDVEIGCVPSEVALTSLVLSSGDLEPPFEAAVTQYTAKVTVGTHLSAGREPITVTATATNPQATIQINGAQVASGAPSQPIPVDANKAVTIEVVVTARSGLSATTTIEATGAPADAYIKAPKAQTGAQFGTSVALAGDTLVVGAPGESSGAGAAYVFVRDGSTWREEASLKASDPTADAAFGTSVAIDADTLVVGAPGTPQISGPRVVAGAAYVFSRSNGAWSAPVRLQGADVVGDEFGVSVAVQGDTAFVGAPASAGGGEVYAFTRSASGTWPQAKVFTGDPTAEFGTSVAIEGDALAVGAPHEKLGDASANVGAVHVYTRDGATWAPVRTITPPAGEYLFGTAVALDGDTLAVGGTGEIEVFTPPSALAYEVVSLDGGAPVFGDTIAASQGVLAAHAGVPGGAGASSDLVYLFRRHGGGFEPDETLQTKSNGDNVLFGHALTLSPDTLAVGASGDGSCAAGVDPSPKPGVCPNAGAVYVYR